MSVNRSVLLTVLLALAQPLGASGSVVEGAVGLTYPAGHWTGWPLADFRGTEADPARDVVYGTGWFLRVDGLDGREYPLPVPDQETYGTNGRGDMVWTNLRGLGLDVREIVRVSDREGPSGGFVSELLIVNKGTQARTLSVFHYLDAKPGGGAGPWESARPSGVAASNHLLLEGRSDGPGLPLVGRLGYRAPGASLAECSGDGLGALANRLDDADLDDFDGTGLTFGPSTAGVNCGFEWQAVTLQPQAARFFRAVITSRQPGLYVKGDLNDDGYPDLLFRTTAQPGRTEIWQMRRTTRLATSVVFGPQGVVAMDDFTRDRENDLVIRHPLTGALSFFPQVAGTFTTAVPLSGADAPPLNWDLAATGDWNRDGWADILWRNRDSQALVIWTMNGPERVGALVPTPDQAQDANWRVVGAGDVDGDGYLDLIWYNATSGRAVIWYMDASVVRTSGGFTTPAQAGDANWVLSAAGDVGRGSGTERPTVADGVDLVWQNQASARLVVWHMNHAGERTSGVFLSPDSAPGLELIGPR